MIGGLRTSITSPGFTVRAGLTCEPFMLTRPFYQLSAAIVRVLKMRDAHIHLSILASAITFIVLVHGYINTGQAETF